jgi:transcriptional regulator with XRE-family HTH domain
MVNAEAFTKRLEQLLAHYELNASSFADAVGVQRSSISHLLSGRNRPSLDFVMKVIARFPEVNLYWLLNGKGEFPPVKGRDGELPKGPSPLPGRADAGRGIERIVICYADGTFQSYVPGMEAETSDRQA